MSFYMTIAKRVSRMHQPIPRITKDIQELEIPAFLRVKKELAMFTR